MFVRSYISKLLLLSKSATFLMLSLFCVQLNSSFSTLCDQERYGYSVSCDLVCKMYALMSENEQAQVASFIISNFSGLIGTRPALIGRPAHTGPGVNSGRPTPDFPMDNLARGRSASLSDLRISISTPSTNPLDFKPISPKRVGPGVNSPTPSPSIPTILDRY